MRWSYKTVHFEMKKEGLLGGAFLDESEIEVSLNEYGKAGWELVAMLETLDGLIAVFKQPISLGSESAYPSREGIEDEYVPLRYPPQDAEELGSQPEGRSEDIAAKASETAAVPIHEDAVAVKRREKEQQQTAPPVDEVGSIRIE